MNNIVEKKWESDTAPPFDAKYPEGQSTPTPFSGENNFLTSFEGIKRNIGLIEERIIKFEIKQSDFESAQRNKIEELRSSLFQSLGIFIAFITFVSVNITIYSLVKDLFSAMIFTLLLFLLLTLFLLIIDILFISNTKETKVFSIQTNSLEASKKESKNHFYKNKVILFIILFLSVVVLFFISWFCKIPLNPVVNSDEFRSEVEKICNERISNNTENIQTRFIKKDEFNDWKALNITNNFDSKTKQESIKNCIKFSNNLQQLKTCFN